MVEFNLESYNHNRPDTNEKSLNLKQTGKSVSYVENQKGCNNVPLRTQRVLMPDFVMYSDSDLLALNRPYMEL